MHPGGVGSVDALAPQGLHGSGQSRRRRPRAHVGLLVHDTRSVYASLPVELLVRGGVRGLGRVVAPVEAVPAANRRSLGRRRGRALLVALLVAHCVLLHGVVDDEAARGLVTRLVMFSRLSSSAISSAKHEHPLDAAVFFC